MPMEWGMGLRPFVITGAPGTDLARTARLFSELGAPCGDRAVFHPAAFERGGTLFWPPELSGDASWYAAPVIDRLPANCVVLHQTSAPLPAIQDLVDSGFFDGDTAAQRFARDFMEDEPADVPLVDAARMWIRWNRMIAAAANTSDVRYRRFGEGEIDEFLVSELLALVGVVRSPATARAALDAADTAQDARPSTLDWSDVSPEALRDELRNAARGFGHAA